MISFSFNINRLKDPSLIFSSDYNLFPLTFKNYKYYKIGSSASGLNYDKDGI
jgi:hypothetical protein